MEQWAQYGVLGLLVMLLVAFLKTQREDHKKEREEWHETIKEQMDKADKRQEETNKTIKDNTGILQGLKTLLEHKR